MRPIQRGIDPAPPFLCTLPQYRKFELESFPIRVEDDVHHIRSLFSSPPSATLCEKGDQSG
jgi:hypothetical protein